MNASLNTKLLSLFFLLLALSLTLALLPTQEYLLSFLKLIDSLGPWGPVIFAVGYAASCILFFPGSILGLGAGFLFGVFIGTVAVSIGSVLGASAAFVLGRTLARRWVDKRIGKYPRFSAIDHAIGKEGLKVVFLLRLSPLFPFNLLNYALGLTKISFYHYVLASWVGMLPGTIMFVYLGSALKSFTELSSGVSGETGAQKGFFIAGLIATLVVVLFVSQIAKNALAEISSEEGEG